MNMRFALLAIGLWIGMGNLQAQKKKEASTPAPTQSETWEQIYRNALKYNDLGTATTASYALIAIHPEDNSRMDTLAAIYFQRQAYPQCILVSEDILKQRPEDAQILEMVAVSKNALGGTLEALKDYEKLYAITKDPYHLYEVASLQYNARRFGEGEENIRKLLAMPEIAERKITLSFQQGSQEVPLKAAIYNLYGVMQLDQGQTVNAEQHFRTALEIDPKFYLAKANLAQLLQPKEQK